jgi:hypothetical protein
MRHNADESDSQKGKPSFSAPNVNIEGLRWGKEARGGKGVGALCRKQEHA